MSYSGKIVKKSNLWDPFFWLVTIKSLMPLCFFFFPFLYLSFFFGQFRPTALFFSYSFFLLQTHSTTKSPTVFSLSLSLSLSLLFPSFFFLSLLLLHPLHHVHQSNPQPWLRIFGSLWNPIHLNNWADSWQPHIQTLSSLIFVLIWVSMGLCLYV